MATPNSCYNLLYLGHSAISKFIPGLGVLQKPLHDLYVSYLTPKGPKMPIVSRLALTDRGIILTANGTDSFYSMRDVLLWEPVHWVHVQTKDKKIMSAFEPINHDYHLSQEGLFSKLDSQYKYLAQLKHDPILAVALRNGSDGKQVEVHAFVCASPAQVFEVARSLWMAEQVFHGQEVKGIVLTNPPQGLSQESPKSVLGSSSGSGGGQRVPNGGGDAARKSGRQSTRQANGRKVVEGEITLEELIRLADRALIDQTGNDGAMEQPPFKMGELWAVKENNGLQRSRTFNDGPIAGREPGNDEVRRGAQDGRHQTPSPASHGAGGVNSNQPQPAPYYENLAPSKSAQQRVYENAEMNFSPSSHGLPRPEVSEDHRQLVDERRHGAQVDPKRKSVQPQSLRAVIADSRLSAANGKRGSVLPGTDFGNAVGDSNPVRQIVDVHFDRDDVPVSVPSKPVALVQPRKVPRFRVLPEAALEGVILNKVPQKQGKDEPRKEQYQLGPSGNGRNYTRSMYELNNGDPPQAVTPQAQRKAYNLDVDPTKKMTSSDLNLARKSSNPELDPFKKNSLPESSCRDGGSRSDEKKKPDRAKKDAEIEALAFSANFERPPVNTISPHGTNFENALGYFP